METVGEIHFERGYDHCRKCHRGCFPHDAALRLSPERMTPAAQEVVRLTGIQSSFTMVADRALWKLSGTRRGESTIQRTTEAAAWCQRGVIGSSTKGERRCWRLCRN